jgi:peptidyl-prolyl cis-trans isomerase C
MTKKPTQNIVANTYLELKIAWEIFQKTPQALSAADLAETRRIAARQQVLEQKILSSPESSAVVILDSVLEAHLDEIRQRYPSGDDFEQDMAQQQMTIPALLEALSRDLRMEAVLDKVAASVEPATEIDAELFYRLNPKPFDRPEIRKLRHILMTIDTPKDEAQARQTLGRLRTEIRTTDDFCKAALRYSQCPTAMDGGLLGKVKRGQLYETLEPVAFALSLGVISEVTASPMGLHILRCEEIQPGGLMPFSEVQQNIQEKLNEQRRNQKQREWIKSL